MNYHIYKFLVCNIDRISFELISLFSEHILFFVLYHFFLFFIFYIYIYIYTIFYKENKNKKKKEKKIEETFYKYLYKTKLF